MGIGRQDLERMQVAEQAEAPGTALREEGLSQLPRLLLVPHRVLREERLESVHRLAREVADDLGPLPDLGVLLVLARDVVAGRGELLVRVAQYRSQQIGIGNPTR